MRMRATPVRSTIALLFALAIPLSALAACSSDGSDGAGSSTTTSKATGSEPGDGEGTDGASPLADRFEAIPAADGLVLYDALYAHCAGQPVGQVLMPLKR